VRRMLTYAGAELDSETVAYHLGYLVKAIILFLVKCEAEMRKNRNGKRNN
jgi:hypothetical protein